MTTLSTSKTNCSLHLLTTHTSDSSPSLLVTFDQHKYLFNVPESLSRVCVQSKISLKKVGKVFVGDLNESVGGLPGLLLSTVESGNNDVEVVAGEGLEHLVASYRFYTRRERLALTTTAVPNPDPFADRSALPPPIHADANLIVYALPLASSSALPIPPTSSRNSTKRTATSRSPSPRRSKSPPTNSSDTASTSKRQFDPSTLVDDAAVEWRRAVISDMFRAGNILPRPTFLPGVRIEQSPAYLMASLPRFAASVKTNISYLAVGPPLRGEFLAKVAMEKGVKAGPKFSALVQGMRVWVTDLVYDVPVRVDGRTKLSKAEGRAAAELRSKWEATIVDGEGPGHWVESQDCNGPGSDGRAFLVLNLSSPEFLDSLTALPASLFTTIKDAQLRTVFYFLGPGVLPDPRLSSWIATLPTDIEHHFSSADLKDPNDPVIFAPTSLLSLRLRELSPSIFSLPHYSFLPKETTADLALLPPTFPANSRIIRPNDQMNLMPPSTAISIPKVKTKTKPTTNPRNPVPPPGSGFRDFNFLVPSPEASEAASRLKSLDKSGEVLSKAAEAWAGYLIESKAVREQVENEEVQAGKMAESESQFEAGDDIIVTPLGTGSAVPSKYRNVSSTLLHLPDGGYILLDAGEGTWGQIARKFGSGAEGKEKILRELKCIFISHIHQDHHAGLATILRQRNQLDPKPEHPLTVIGPQGARIYLSEQHELSDMGLGSEHAGTSREVIFINNFSVEFGGNMNERSYIYEKMKNLEDLLGLESIATVPVLHRCKCWGVVIVHKSGWKVVFSGDTMPCDALVRAGHGATLLIHEATIESDKPEVALLKGHSTFAQAIDIAKRMEAKTCLLTHFSARYPKLPPLKSTSHSPDSTSSESGDGSDPLVAIAFDLMSLRVDEFWKMEKFQSAMEVLFDDGEDKTIKEDVVFEEIGE